MVYPENKAAQEKNGLKSTRSQVDRITVMLHVSANGSLQERQSAVGSRQALSFVYVDRTGWSNSELDEFRDKMQSSGK